ncbi:MAG: hypothetical protein Q7R48_02755 [bacterium]|nr:hypothetical protein [bacterium]
MSVSDKLFFLGLFLMIAGIVATIVFNDEPVGLYDTEVEENAGKDSALRFSPPVIVCLIGIVFLFAGASTS